MFAELQQWTIRRWTFAAGAALAVMLLVGLPTDVIPNPVFGRPVDVTWWSYPVLVVTGVLGGLLAATYVRDDRWATIDATGAAAVVDDERAARRGSAAGLLSFSRSAVQCATSWWSWPSARSAHVAGSSRCNHCSPSGPSS